MLFNIDWVVSMSSPRLVRFCILSVGFGLKLGIFIWESNPPVSIDNSEVVTNSSQVYISSSISFSKVSFNSLFTPVSPNCCIFSWKVSALPFLTKLPITGSVDFSDVLKADNPPFL